MATPTVPRTFWHYVAICYTCPQSAWGWTSPHPCGTLPHPCQSHGTLGKPLQWAHFYTPRCRQDPKKKTSYIFVSLYAVTVTPDEVKLIAKPGTWSVRLNGNSLCEACKITTNEKSDIFILGQTGACVSSVKPFERQEHITVMPLMGIEGAAFRHGCNKAAWPYSLLGFAVVFFEPRFGSTMHEKKNGFVTATKLGTTNNKIFVVGTKNFPQQPNDLLIEPNILLL